ncbi:MAG: hypothetical protein NTZ34_07865 [Chloroflexi bacterium]|nr:hypothetical protein [Chloroflexota bacterium]
MTSVHTSYFENEAKLNLLARRQYYSEHLSQSMLYDRLEQEVLAGFLSDPGASKTNKDVYAINGQGSSVAGAIDTI